jgi:hypothetical protein
MLENVHADGANAQSPTPCAVSPVIFAITGPEVMVRGQIHGQHPDRPAVLEDRPYRDATGHERSPTPGLSNSSIGAIDLPTGRARLVLAAGGEVTVLSPPRSYSTTISFAGRS